MNYEFPIIKRLEDVLPAVEGRDEFVVAEREGFTVVNYNVGYADTFNIDEDDLMENHGRMIPKGIMRRELRGIIFDADGVLMSRPFDKWFNINEREETMAHRLDFSTVKAVMTKLDGSMIRPLLLNGEIRWATKMGTTDVAAQVDEYTATESRYLSFARWAMAEGLTPIFEWTAPFNRIVIAYEKPALTLLAVRENRSGRYLSF